jgi:hypothetical protein
MRPDWKYRIAVSPSCHNANSVQIAGRNAHRDFFGSVSKVEMTTPMALICQALFPSLSTFETPPIAFLTRVLMQTTQPIILIQDGAKYHTSAETKAFFAQQTARLEVVQLPAYSPDYNPIEKLWKKIKQ